MKSDKKCKIVIGKDARLSSYTLEYALAAGITQSGGDAYILHVTTTPSVSFITRCDGFDFGVMISASHNLFYDNGIKIVNSLGEKIDDKTIALIENYLDGKHELPCATDFEIGRTVDYVSGRNRYIGHLISLATCSYKGFKVGIDASNGSAFNIAKSVFDALGAKTYLCGCSPDGLNINLECGSTHPQNLQRLVKENSLDVGFAFDGDADRCIAVDEHGEIVTGDGLLYILACELEEKGEMENGVVFTVMSNGGLQKSLKKLGIESHITAVGDRAVYEKMCSCGAVLGGEESGHIVLSKYETTGDGVLTALMIMEILVEKGVSMSTLLKGYKPLFKLTENAEFTQSGYECALAAAEKIENVRIIVRKSGTEPLIRLLAEGEEQDCRRAIECLKRAIGGDICAE